MGVSNAWADEGDFYNTYLTYTFGATSGSAQDKDNGTGLSKDLGTLNSGSFKITAVYLKCWDDWGSNYKSSGGQMCYSKDGGGTQYLTGFSRSNKAYESNNYEWQNTNANLTIANSTDKSGSYTLTCWFQTWGWGDRFFPKSSGNYTFTYKIAPPSVKGFTVTPSGNKLSGSGTQNDPYIIKYNGSLTLTLSGSQNHTDANSTIQYNTSGTWDTTKSRTISNVNSTEVKNVTVKARYKNNSDAYLCGTESSKIIYYRSEQVYTVTFNANGHGTAPAAQTVSQGSKATQPTAPTATGYIFGGWYKEANCTNAFDFNTAIIANITLYAKWKPITYYVKFNANGGSGSMSNQTFTYGTAQNLTANAFTRTGYTFAGWTTNENGSGTSYADKASVDNLSTTNGATVNLYAKWTKVHTITLNPNGGTIDDNDWIYDNGTGYYTQTVSEGTVLNFPTATKTGYTNIGWKKNNTGDAVASITASENATYTAAYNCALATVGISGTYALTVGDVFELVATAYDSNGDVLTCPANTTHSWERYNSVDGVWEAITDDNSDGDDAKLTFNNCQIANCGTYRCHITYGDCGEWSWGYDVHCFHLKGDFEGDWNIEYAFNHTDEEGIATLSMDLITGNTFYFKIYDGISQYGNGGTIETSVTGWIYGSDNQSNTTLKTGADGTYIFKLDYKQLINGENILVLDVQYPPANQTEGHTIYYDNLVHNWQNVYYRIGHNRDNGDGTWGWNQNQKMTKVPGTSHLYTTKTPQFDNFEAWQVANNVAWSGEYSIYDVNTNDKYAITHATEYKKFVVVEDITLTPEATGSLNSTENCTYYPATKQSGMKKHNAKIIASPTGGTITVSYTDHDGTAKSDFTSGDRDLAHTCLLTITATPDAGYSLASLTVNDVPFTSGKTHTLTENAVIKATFAINTYIITLDQQGGTGGSESIEVTYDAELPAITIPTREGYTFGGYFTSENGEGTQYYNQEGTAYYNKKWDIASTATLYAKWTVHEYKVIFNANGGEGSMDKQSFIYDVEQALTKNEFTRDGYSFAGWNDKANGSGTSYADQQVVKNLTATEKGQKTLYAQWAAIHTVTWMVNGGQAEGDPTTSVVNGQTITTLPTTPDVDCNGKVFVGWTTAPIHGETATIPDPLYAELGAFPAVTSNMTFYAVFANGSGEERWVETKINDIEATDEVVVMMAHGTNLYALPYDKETAGNSNPVATSITLDDFEGRIVDELIWFITKDHESNNFTLSPKIATTLYLTCNSSNNAVRINTGVNRIFTIENDFLKNTTFNIYLAISTATPKDWRHYASTNTTIFNRVQTLKFYKKTIVYTSYTNYSTSCMAGVCDITNANPIYVTSAVGQKIKAVDKLVLTTTDMAVGTEISLSAPNITFYKEGVEITQLTTSAASETFELEIAYQPTIANKTEQPTITLDILGYKFTIDNKITARSLPETFAVVAKVGNMWYALPEVGYEAEKHATAYPVEVDDAADPTAVTSAVANNAAWSLRQVYQAQHSNAQHDRYATSGSNFVLENKQDPAKLLNASAQGDKGSNNYLLTSAQYDNYYSTNPGLYEWTPTTADLETYTLTNVQRTDKQINISTNAAFGVHSQNVVTTEVRFLPIQGRYTPMAAQVVEWKEKSVVVMYNGDPSQAASVSVNGGSVQTTELSGDDVQKDIAVYELTADGLATNPTQRLSITIGTEKAILPIPYIVSSETTDLALLPGDATVSARQEVAKVADLVVLKDAKLTADGTKGNPYKFRNVTIYGGGSLVIPNDKGFGANSLTMRVGGVEDGKYVYTYPQLDLNGKINSGNINLDLMTTYDYYYPFSVPYEVTLTDIHYPVEIYGSNVKPTNKGSFLVSYYDGEERAKGNSGWKDVEEQGKEVLSPHVGYSIWGLPKKVSVNGATSTRQTFGIHRIPMKKNASDVMGNETQNCTVRISSYEATRDNDKGWNFIGNPYLAQYGSMENNTYIHMGLLEKEMKDGQWTGGWVFNGEAVRYVTQTNDCLNYTSTPVTNATIPAFSAFFIQAKETGAIAFTSPNVAAAQSLTARRSDENKEITTGIILSGEKHSDRTGLLIADKFTEAYEFNADLSKFDNQDMNLYTIAPSGKLAFMAINEELAKQTIPLGYSVSADGMYTIAFDEQRYNRNDIYALYLIDYDRNETTNLLQTDYNFYSELGAHVERFALQVAFAQKTPTDVEYTQVGNVLVSREGNTLRLDNLPSNATVTIYDAVGHLIEQHSPSQHLQVNLPTGYYLMHIANKQDAVVIDTFIP